MPRTAWVRNRRLRAYTTLDSRVSCLTETTLSLSWQRVHTVVCFRPMTHGCSRKIVNTVPVQAKCGLVALTAVLDDCIDTLDSCCCTILKKTWLKNQKCHYDVPTPPRVEIFRGDQTCKNTRCVLWHNSSRKTYIPSLWVTKNMWKQDNVHMNTESVQCISTVYSIGLCRYKYNQWAV